jgi:hypothetical protein
MYANDDPSWVYFNRSYYDFTVNTFDHNKEDTLKIVLDAIKK